MISHIKIFPPCLKKVFSNYHQVTLLISFIHPPEYLIILLIINMSGGAFLVVEWLRMYFATQGTPVRSLVWEDPRCRGASKPMPHSY